MNLKSYSFILVFFIGIHTSTAQDFVSDENNLVPNPSFETLHKRVKESGSIVLANPWFSPTMYKSDLYTESGKNGFSSANNNQGEEGAYQGKNYAGIRLYGYRNRLSKTFLEVKLKQPLEMGKTYCVRFYYSLSDGSRYASNNLTAFLSKGKVVSINNIPLDLKPEIQLQGNPILEKQKGWASVCSDYTAEGGEQYLVIGNFNETESTKTKQIRRPRDWHSPQTRDAYYFIDQVEVVASDKLPNCDCKNIQNEK